MSSFPTLTGMQIRPLTGQKVCKERKEPMGEAFKDEFTEEELKILDGDTLAEKTEDVKPEGTGTLEAEKSDQETVKPTDEKTDETKQSEAQTEDEKKAVEAMGLRVVDNYIVDDDGTKIPAKRWKSLYKDFQETRRENEQLKEKQTLFKTVGPDKFYELYPDEAPQGYTPPVQKVTTPAPEGFNVLNMVVNGGQYSGMTLREVMQIDPEDGTRMLNEWKDSQYAEVRKQEETVTRTKKEQTEDAESFLAARIEELYGTDAAKKPTSEQLTKATLIGQEVIEWQKKTGRLNLKWDDAFKLMRHDDLIKKAREEGASGTFKGLQKAGPVSINTGNGGDVKPSGWEEVAAMTEKALERHIESLNDVSYKKFFKEAPASIRAKHPGMPWE